MTLANPPRWADVLLRFVLGSDRGDTVSGDLLEEYRDSVVETRGRLGADAWYVRQVVGFVLRSAGAWIALVAVVILARGPGVVDTLPVHSALARFFANPWIGVWAIFLTGFAGAWRSRSIVSGMVTSFIALSSTAVLVDLVNAYVLLTGGGRWRPDTLPEFMKVFGGMFIVIAMAMPVATLGATLGAIAGSAVRRLRSLRHAS